MGRRSVLAASLLGASTLVGGGGTEPIDFGGNFPTFAIYGNHRIIDWWQWSFDPANGDLFGIAARATGGNTYWCDPNTGGGSGTQGSPWSPSQLKSQLDNRSLPAQSVVHMLPGDYNGKGLAGGENQVSGGGGGGGWVTLLGPENGAGEAKLDCSTDTRGWSMKGTAARIQFVRIRTRNVSMNQAYANYVNGGGGAGTATGGNADPEMRNRIGGHNPGGIGFQLDGFPSGGRPGPAVYVNCVAQGWGEGFGSFQAGNAYTIGCVGFESAWASPNGRSNFSFSWFNGGKATTPNGYDVIVSSTLGANYFGGAFGCLSFHAFQLHPSSGIGHPNSVTDGNGLILPTDGFDSPQGRFFQQANVIYGISGAGLTGFEGAVDGMDIANNTVFHCGYNSAHTSGQNPFGLPTRLILGKGGSGPAMLPQRYISGRINPQINNNIAIGSPYDSRSLQAWTNIDAQGSGNVWSRAPIGGAGANVSALFGTTTGAQIIAGNSASTAVADAHLVAGSPAIGQGFISQAPFPIDFEGNPLVDRGNGRCDAGAYQYALAA